MIQFINYNFLKDGDSLNPYPTNVNNITSVQIQNARFNGFFMSKDVTTPYSNVIPTEWDIYTIMLATLDHTLNAGSVDYTLDDIDSIRIKRRKIGEFEWATIYEQPITTYSDFMFSGEDYFAQNETEYEYAWVPVLANIEGNYITQTITSKFAGVFICDANTIYKFMSGVAYGSSQQIQKVGLYNPLGQKYPIYVSNGATNYQTGSFQGKILGNYEHTGILNRKEMVETKNALLEWITNKKAKILKDWNGNIWLIYITNEPSITYDTQWGNGLMELNFQYGEVGNPNNINDMQNVGLWPVME